MNFEEKKSIENENSSCDEESFLIFDSIYPADRRIQMRWKEKGKQRHQKKFFNLVFFCTLCDGIRSELGGLGRIFEIFFGSSNLILNWTLIGN